MSDKTLAEMSRIVRQAAEPRAPSDSAKAAISRAATRLGISYRRARSFWYEEPTAAVGAAEADQLRAVELRLLQDRGDQLERELNEIRDQLRAASAADRPRGGNGGTHDGISLAGPSALAAGARARLAQLRARHLEIVRHNRDYCKSVGPADPLMDGAM